MFLHLKWIYFSQLHTVRVGGYDLASPPCAQKNLVSFVWPREVSCCCYWSILGAPTTNRSHSSFTTSPRATFSLWSPQEPVPKYMIPHLCLALADLLPHNSWLPLCQVASACCGGSPATVAGFDVFLGPSSVIGTEYFQTQCLMFRTLVFVLDPLSCLLVEIHSLRDLYLTVVSTKYLKSGGYCTKTQS